MLKLIKLIYTFYKVNFTDYLKKYKENTTLIPYDADKEVVFEYAEEVYYQPSTMDKQFKVAKCSNEENKKKLEEEINSKSF